MSDDEKLKKLSDRARDVIAAHCFNWPLRGRYKKLEEETGVAERKWKMLNNKVTFPTIETLIALSQLEPRFSAYLLIGNDFPSQIGMISGEESERRQKENEQDEDYRLQTMQDDYQDWLRNPNVMPDFKKM